MDNNHINRYLHMRILASIVVVIAAGAVYGQTLDIIWQREGAGDHSYYGSTIIPLGDQNGDTLNDWAVFAQGWGDPGQDSEPKVEFFRGGRPFPSAQPYWSRLTQTPAEEYLWGMRALGDLNGDGFIDWAFIVELGDDSLHRDVYKIHFGGPGSSGDAGGEPDIVLTAPGLSAFWPIEDFNGDDYDDLILSNGRNDRAEIIYGGNPMDTILDWSREGYLGAARFGDFNGDGYSDFATDAYWNYLDIFLGDSIPDTLSAYHWEIAQNRVDGIRDVNGDGFDEIGLSRAGGLSLYFGETNLALSTVLHQQLDFPCSGSSPLRVGSAGDVNQDGFNDIVMLHESCAGADYGVLTVHLGGTQLSPAPVVTIYGGESPYDLLHFKSAVGLGDVNGDGVDDLGVGANGGIEYAAQRGKAVILAGDPSLGVGVDDPFTPQPSSLALSVYPNPFNASTTIAYSLPRISDVTLRVFNTVGQTVFSENMAMVPSGEQRYLFNASDLPSGVYFARVEAADMTQTQKMVSLK